MSVIDGECFQMVTINDGVHTAFVGVADNKAVNILSKPGLCLQALTTKEPDDSMIEVGIASVEAVFDWKKYLNENFGAHYEREDEDTK